MSRAAAEEGSSTPAGEAGTGKRMGEAMLHAIAGTAAQMKLKPRPALPLPQGQRMIKVRGPTMSRGHGDKLPGRLGEAVAAYFEESSHVKIAARLRVSRVTWWRWRKRPEFREALRAERRRQ